jgi:hypothetical protein
MEEIAFGDEPEDIDELNDETFGGMDADTGPEEDDFPGTTNDFFFFLFSFLSFLAVTPPVPRKLDPSLAPSTRKDDDEEGPEQDGSFTMESIYDSLVGEDDREQLSSSGPGGLPGGPPQNASQFPPWFSNFPGYSPQDLAELVHKGRLPPHVEQLLRSRQAEFMRQLGGGGPPVPVKLLSKSAEANRTDDLFDRHHHTHLVYWKRSFKHMSADEVDALIAQQRNLLKHSTYAEDYYYQHVTARTYGDHAPPKTVPPLMGVHRPICLEALEPPARPAPDMQAGTLGKLAFSTLKGPKPLVHLGRPVPEAGPHRCTSSAAIQKLEAGEVNAHLLLSVVEDGLLLVLQIADMASVLPQLPPAEQPFFLSKQQQLVGALVYILNVFVGRRSALFASLVRMSKGRLFLSRCLASLPLEQRSALLLFCLSQASLLISLPHDDPRTRALSMALVRGCGSVVGTTALSLLQAVGQAFVSQQDFHLFACSPWGAAVLAELLGAVLRSRPPAGVWEPVVAGLFEALSPLLQSMASVIARDEALPLIALVLHLSLLISKQQNALLGSLVRPLLVGVRAKPTFSNAAPQLKQLLEILGL